MMTANPVPLHPAPVYPNAKFPDEIDPSNRPSIYAFTAQGGCLEPVFLDGECIAFSKDEEVQPGDYVGICLVPDEIHPGELPNRVKRLRSIMPGITFPYRCAPTSEIVPIVELEQHNPPRVLRVRVDRILAMHKVIGTAKAMEDGTARLVPLEADRLDRLDYVFVDCA
jgi:hypothetical protein